MKELKIPGLFLASNFIEPKDQFLLLGQVDLGDWSNVLKRRVQHFGYCYDYRKRNVSQSMKTVPIPGWGKDIIQIMLERNITTKEFDQLIINEYLPGQGITPHVDCVSCFEDEIVSVSLGSSCVMTFSRANQKDDTQIDIFLEPGNLLVMRNEARYEWQHQIKARKSDIWQELTIKRSRRISLTFRKVILDR
jgi:alkylated DNA repair dioxygenase AlkB